MLLSHEKNPKVLHSDPFLWLLYIPKSQKVKKVIVWTYSKVLNSTNLDSKLPEVSEENVVRLMSFLIVV